MFNKKNVSEDYINYLIDKRIKECGLDINNIKLSIANIVNATLKEYVESINKDIASVHKSVSNVESTLDIHSKSIDDLCANTVVNRKLKQANTLEELFNGNKKPNKSTRTEGSIGNHCLVAWYKDSNGKNKCLTFIPFAKYKCNYNQDKLKEVFMYLLEKTKQLARISSEYKANTGKEFNVDSISKINVKDFYGSNKIHEFAPRVGEALYKYMFICGAFDHMDDSGVYEITNNWNKYSSASVPKKFE